MTHILRNRLFGAIVLLVLAIPAFTGLYLDWGPEVLLGIRAGRFGYLAVIALAVLALRGRTLWLTAFLIALVILLSVVGGGLALALILHTVGYSPMTMEEIFRYYLGLAVNMATVIPLGLALVSLIPFASIESRMLRDPRGVGRLEKLLLMALRVFNHVLFAVMPEIIQVVSEELRFNNHAYNAIKGPKRRVYWKSLVGLMTFVAFTALCNSLEYIHFWAAEISNLPDRK